MIDVYYNRHKKLLSLRATKGEKSGLVISYAPKVHLVNCEFRVNEAGRQRVLQQKRRNVHACVRGTQTSLYHELMEDFDSRADVVRLTYNPYKHSAFVRVDTGTAVKTAERVLIDGDRIFAIGVT